MKICRRSLLLGSVAPLLAATQVPLAICSETFTGLSFEAACRSARAIGYDAVEIQPSDLGPDPASLSSGQRQSIRRMMTGNGLGCVGLHSFLKAPSGLHLTTPDATVRKKSWDYFARLIDLARDLTDQPLMILGSSKQRAAVDGTTQREAIDRLISGLHRMAPLAAERNVTILIEPLAPQLCNIINTLKEAMIIVRAVNSRAIQTMFDCHNTAAEQDPIDILIREYMPYIRHVHLNEMDGRRPGADSFPIDVLLRALKNANYRGWLSVEVFDFKPDGETVARLACQYVRSVESKVLVP
jgi:D-psicose/D-tagatose/L-ribulose 3-epimerase